MACSTAQQPEARPGTPPQSCNPHTTGLQASPHSPQHGYLAAGMVAYHAAPYGPYGQHVLYYPTAAGMAPYQQPLYQQGPAPGAQWHQQRPGMPGQPQRGGMPGHAGQQLQQAGPGGYSMGAVPRGPPGHYGYAGFPGGPMAPHTPAASGSQQRQPPMAQAGSSSSASAGSTGWGGVPLSQSAAEAIVGGAQPRPGSSCSQELPTPLQLPPKPVVALVAATEPAAEAVAHTQLAAAAEEEPGEGESASLAGPSSSSSDAEEAGSSQRSDAAAVDASISNGGGSGGREGKPEQAGSSSEGSSGDSRRSSRGSRERQPCAFFLKTGTCAYGDRWSCCSGGVLAGGCGGGIRLAAQLHLPWSLVYSLVWTRSCIVGLDASPVPFRAHHPACRPHCHPPSQLQVCASPRQGAASGVQFAGPAAAAGGA